jgi:hypothetical protein
MWWLVFSGGGVVIIEATSLSHARLLAAVMDLGRASKFVQGDFVDPDLAAMIPDDFLDRLLSSDEARRLKKLLKYGRLLSRSPEYRSLTASASGRSP